MPNEFWTGFYSSRADSKKMIRDTSAYLQASEKAFAKEVIKADTNDEKVSQIMSAKDEIFDIMGVMQHHDAVTGTERQHVANDYLQKANTAVQNSNVLYEQILAKEVQKITGIKAFDLSQCIGQNNDTVKECPIYTKG